MKKLSLITLLVLASTTCFAETPLMMNCSNGEEIRMTLKQVENDSYDLSVTVQSTGDSYPEFHYQDLREVPPVPHMMGAPMVFKNEKAQFSVNFTTALRVAYLNIPELGIDNAQLKCE